GELAAVAEQVEEDLAHLRRVGPHRPQAGDGGDGPLARPAMVAVPPAPGGSRVATVFPPVRGGLAPGPLIGARGRRSPPAGGAPGVAARDRLARRGGCHCWARWASIRSDRAKSLTRTTPATNPLT